MSVKLTPPGSAPLSARLGAGGPTEVTGKEPAAPTVKVAWPALVIAGAWLTVSVKAWVPSAPTPLWAVTVKL